MLYKRKSGSLSGQFISWFVGFRWDCQVWVIYKSLSVGMLIVNVASAFLFTVQTALSPKSRSMHVAPKLPDNQKQLMSKLLRWGRKRNPFVRIKAAGIPQEYTISHIKVSSVFLWSCMGVAQLVPTSLQAAKLDPVCSIWLLRPRVCIAYTPTSYKEAFILTVLMAPVLSTSFLRRKPRTKPPRSFQ